RRLRGALPRLLALRLLPRFLLRRGQDRDLVIPDSCDTSLAPSRKVGESAKVALKVAGFAQREVQPRGRHFEGVAWPEVNLLCCLGRIKRSTNQLGGFLEQIKIRPVVSVHCDLHAGLRPGPGKG